MMGPFCLWETCHFLRQGDSRSACRRWTAESAPSSLGVQVRYPSIRGIKTALKGNFKLLSWYGIGLLVPPSYVKGLSAPDRTSGRDRPTRSALACSADALRSQASVVRTAMTSTIGNRHRFLEEYRHIRHAEGRGSENPDYYRALPYADLSGTNPAAWAMRARTYRYFEQKILAPFERRAGRPLDILDLGAGNGWMSYGFRFGVNRSRALDIFNDARDGLLAAKNYPQPFPLIEAEFDSLPFPVSSFDLAIYNSSFHYSVNYSSTLKEAKRCLRPDGRIVILDSPVYRLPRTWPANGGGAPRKFFIALWLCLRCDPEY